MCDDFESDYSSDVSDSSFDVSDDVSSDIDSDFSDVSFETDDSSFDISDDFDTFDDYDDMDLIDVSDESYDDVETLDFDDDIGDIDDLSFEDTDIDVADDFIDASDESYDDVETLDFDDDIDNIGDLSFEDTDVEDIDIGDDVVDVSDELDEVETFEFDDEIENTEELTLDDDIETLEIDEFSDEDFDVSSDIETLELDDIDEVSDEDIEIPDDFEALESEEIVDDVLDDALTGEKEFTDDEVETLDFDDEFQTSESDDVTEYDTSIDDETENLEFEENADFSETDSLLEYEDASDEEIIPTSETEFIDEEGFETDFENMTEQIEADDAYDIPEQIETDEVDSLNDETIADEGIAEGQEDTMIDEFEDEFQETESEALTDSEFENILEEYEEGVTNPGDIPTYSETEELPQMTDEELGEFVDWENSHDNAYYNMIDDIKNDPSLSDEQKDALIQPMLEELQEAENIEPEYGARVKGLTYDGRDMYTRPPEDFTDEVPDYYDGNDYEFESTLNEYEEQITNPGNIPEYSEMEDIENNDIDEDFSGELSEQDYDAIYEGLDEYDFHGVDCLEDTERLDASLENFTSENWENLSIDEQKEQMTDLAQYIIDVTGLENPPKIEFYNNPEEGDYGGFNRTTNTLSINEHMLYQNDEAADTVAHELWHAYQYERASNPRTKMDYMYLENFNDYITPSDDFEGYQSQLLESEARAFAQQIKDRLNSY